MMMHDACSLLLRLLPCYQLQTDVLSIQCKLRLWLHMSSDAVVVSYCIHCLQVRLSFTVDVHDVEVAKSILDHCLKKNVGDELDEYEDEEAMMMDQDDDMDQDKPPTK